MRGAGRNRRGYGDAAREKKGKDLEPSIYVTSRDRGARERERERERENRGPLRVVAVRSARALHFYGSESCKGLERPLQFSRDSRGKIGAAGQTMPGPGFTFSPLRGL
jgi:hypothetical protein